MRVYVGAAVLLVVAAAIAGTKHAGFSWSPAWQEALSLETNYVQTLGGFSAVLMVPLGGLIVVVCRLTLGIRMLGPFRPILIAIGLEGAGLVFGLVFTVGVFAIMLALRPRLSGYGLPYFARLTVMVIVVVLVEIVIILAGNAWDLGWVSQAPFFPVVVLCLAAEGFARVLSDEGARSAIWRGATTLGVAVVIYLAHEIPGLIDTQLRYPELALAVIGAIMVIGKACSFRWLAFLNPEPLPANSTHPAEASGET